jgi:hypothetical protein
MSAHGARRVDMSGDRHDVDSEIVLPAGMELVVPPAPSEPVDTRPAMRPGAAAEDSSAAAERVIFPPFVHRGELRQAPAI